MNTLQEFIDYFAAIPHERWCEKTFQLGDCGCALGLLFVEQDGKSVPSDDAYNLLELTQHCAVSLVSVNDKVQPGFPQARPKARVLAYLTKLMKES